VAGLEAASGVRFERIAAARNETEQRLGERRERFASLEVDPHTTVVLMGSWGRREVTSESDDDFMILVESPLDAEARPAIVDVAAALGSRPPRPEEIFAGQVSLSDLRRKIGRDEDTNANLTRRMLFLLGPSRCAARRPIPELAAPFSPVTSRRTSRATGHLGSFSTT
jgi:hypothetical protein